MSPPEAVVYIPEDVDCNEGLYARRGVAHIERAGHRFGGVLRKLKDVLEKAAAGAIVVFARQEHAASVSRWKIKREFVGEVTCRLIPIVQEDAGSRPGVPSPRPVGRHHGRATPCDESPTVAILDRWRVVRQRNGRIPDGDRSPRGDDGGFAERFLEDRYRRS